MLAPAFMWSRTSSIVVVAWAFVACARAEEPPAAATTELRAQPMPPAAQGVQGPAPHACTVASGPLPDDARVAIQRALAEERHTESTYDALAAAPSTPRFGRIARAESRHASELERLLRAHGAVVPEGTWFPPPAAADARAACAIGVESERRTMALYDELLAKPLPDDVRCVFERLRAMSKDRHLPAFERCAR